MPEMSDKEKLDALMGVVGKLADSVGKLAEEVKEMKTAPPPPPAPAPQSAPMQVAQPQVQPAPQGSGPRIIGRIDSVQSGAADQVRSGPQMDMTIRVMKKYEELSMGGQGTVASDQAIWNPRVPNKKAREEHYQGRDIKPIGENE